ncbi:MAG: hypothetical protein KA886_04345 [Candidatus Cloacimonetes bacterium]|jgi:urea transporter|nr:hypothetical protein [Candidatus Cloacimonadota bacterium]
MIQYQTGLFGWNPISLMITTTVFIFKEKHQTEHKRQLFAELFTIVDTKSILVVMQRRRVKRLYCPFWVICKVDVPPLK